MRNTILSKNNPYNIRQQFTTLDAFKKYLFSLSITELKELLNLFTTAEFYEDCRVIDNVIQEKIKSITTP